MAGFGAAPKPGARRPQRGLGGAALRQLPVAGRQGETPAWPLGGRRTRREIEIWERLWKTPQAVAWEELGWHDMVARYARLEAVAERRGTPMALLAETRQLEDRLGLSPLALLRLRWAITEEEDSGSEPAAGAIDIRDRLASS